MEPQLPVLLALLFIATVIATLVYLYLATRSNLLIGLSVLWLVVQGLAAWSGFYKMTDGLPPRFALVVIPPMLLIVIGFTLPTGQRWLDTLDKSWLTWLHVVRMPVELTLYFLFLYGMVPELMTFTGRNLDILSGITAPLIAWYGYKHHYLDRRGILIWNFMCLALLLNIVVNAALSAPFDLQQQAFDQPNRAVLYFPYVWLPGFVVPVVLFSHLVCIRALWRMDEWKVS